MWTRILALACLIPTAGSCGTEPTPYRPENTITSDDLHFLEVPDPSTGAPIRFFAIGYDTHRQGPWDGVTGADGCGSAPDGTPIGRLDNAQELNELAHEAGANFAYVWSGRDRLGATGGRIFGIWHDGYGLDPPPQEDVVPVIFNGAGEADMDADRDARAASLRADFLAFQERSGPYAPEARPGLPGYVEMPWYAWHPTWRLRGEGDGQGEECSDAQADAFASATTMMIGDNYTYVINRWPSWLNPITGQKGEEGEGYDLWLARDDPDHQSYFEAAWRMIRSAVERSGRLPADPDHPTVVWAWMQGHAFDDDIGLAVCQDGSSDLWARGPFPTPAYLRKEIASTVVAGGTGIIFFGYMYCRAPEADRVRAFMRALSHPEVYGPALLSPRLDLGVDLAFTGEAGRAHLMARWHEPTRTAYLIGANPGAHETRVSVELPWSIARVELLDWGEPSPAVAGFREAAEVEIHDRALRYTVPRDDGFIMRLTPVFR